MAAEMTYSSLSYSSLLRQSWPIILANASVPVLGLIDTAVIGHFGTLSELASLAMAALIFSFVYWSFGFLRMGTTGFVARADGVNNTNELMRVVLQSSLLAFVIALLLLVSQVFILWLSLLLLSAPADIVADIKTYFYIRIWGAPATLLHYVMIGVFIGLGDSRRVLYLQLFLNITNAILDVLFAGVYHQGIGGVALGTVIAEYATLALAASFLFKRFAWQNYLGSITRAELLRDIAALFSQNRDIFIRTLFLLLSFVFFTRTSGNFGPVVLAANYILLQLISFSAFFLDGFAFALESVVGKTVGKKSLTEFNLALKRMTVLIFLSAILIGLGIYVVGEYAVALLTNKTQVINVAVEYLPLAVVYVVVSAAAYELDGVFIGAGYSSAMRDCSIASALCFVVAWFAFLKDLGVSGLWIALIVYVFARGLSLFLFLPQLKRRFL